MNAASITFRALKFGPSGTTAFVTKVVPSAERPWPGRRARFGFSKFVLLWQRCDIGDAELLAYLAMIPEHG